MYVLILRINNNILVITNDALNLKRPATLNLGKANAMRVNESMNILSGPPTLPLSLSKTSYLPVLLKNCPSAREIEAHPALRIPGIGLN